MAANVVNTHYIDVVFEALRAHVDGMTPQQQMSFTQQVMSMSPASSSSPMASDMSDSPSPPAAPRSPVLAARRKSARSKALKIRSLAGKKPLNAFMAFRGKTLSSSDKAHLLTLNSIYLPTTHRHPTEVAISTSESDVEGRKETASVPSPRIGIQ